MDKLLIFFIGVDDVLGCGILSQSDFVLAIFALGCLVLDFVLAQVLCGLEDLMRTKCNYNIEVISRAD